MRPASVLGALAGSVARAVEVGLAAGFLAVTALLVWLLRTAGDPGPEGGGLLAVLVVLDASLGAALAVAVIVRTAAGGLLGLRRAAGAGED